MKIDGLTLAEFQEIVGKVSDEVYDGNVILTADSCDGSGLSCTARIRASDPDGPGSRRSSNGRRQAAACWHAHRDVIHEVFERFPATRIVTGMAVYRGMFEFLKNYPGTADQNIGSERNPAYMPDLCECGSAIAWPSWLS